MNARLRSRRDGRGRFILPWPAEAAGRGFGDLLRWQWQRMRDGVPPNPAPDAFPTGSPRLAQPRGRAGEIRITWIGHATFLVQLGAINILTDPVWSRRASPVRWSGPARLVPPAVPFDALPPIDLVILSHDHYDHLDAPTVRALAGRFRGAVAWVAPVGHRSWLARHGALDIHELDWWDDVALDTGAGQVRVTAVPAQHWSQRTPFTRQRRLWAAFTIAAGASGRIFFGGDSGYFDGYRAIGVELGPFDAAMLPIGAYEPRWFMKPAHMNPEEAVRAYVDLGAAGLFCAMHWGTFRLTDEHPLEPPRRVREAWRHAGLDDAALWVPAHGETRITKPR